MSLEKHREDKFFKTLLVGLSERTKQNYADEIWRWIVFVNMTPTQHIQKAHVIRIHFGEELENAINYLF